MTTMTIDPDDPNGPALPALGDEVRLHDIAGYTEDEQTAAASLVPVEIPGTDPDHVVARVLNAAINWENAATDWDASQRGTSMHTLFAATDALHAAIRAYMPMVAK